MATKSGPRVHLQCKFLKDWIGCMGGKPWTQIVHAKVQGMISVCIYRNVHTIQNNHYIGFHKTLESTEYTVLNTHWFFVTNANNNICLAILSQMVPLNPFIKPDKWKLWSIGTQQPPESVWVVNNNGGGNVYLHVNTSTCTCKYTCICNTSVISFTNVWNIDTDIKIYVTRTKCNI